MERKGKQEVSPHKWAKEIIAWATNGAKIECRLRDSDVWTLESNPSWFEDVEYRIYNPFREVKEAFERGETIQGRMDNPQKFGEPIERESKYKKGFEELLCYFDSISEDEQPKIAKKLEELGLI